MKSAKIAAFGLLTVSLVCLVLNYVGRGNDSVTVSGHEVESIKDTVNVIVAVNWTNSVRARRDHRTLLTGSVRDSLGSVMAKTFSGKELNVSYSCFGLARPNPDFERNYIKNFLSNRSAFSSNEWLSLIGSLTRENSGTHTALTVAKHLSVIKTSSFNRKYDENYLIFVTDDFFNVGRESAIPDEMRELERYSDGESSPANKIGNIASAESLATQFMRDYEFVSLRTIDFWSSRESQRRPDLRLGLFKIAPSTKQDARNFLQYPEQVEYELLSEGQARIPLKLAMRRDVIERARYSPNRLLVSVKSPTDSLLYQRLFLQSNLPSEVVLSSVPGSELTLHLAAYYDYNDNGIFGRLREKHLISIPCKQTSHGKLLFMWHVRGKLLQFHHDLGVFRGQKAAASLWNFIFLLTLLLWVIPAVLPYITPPAPKVSFDLKTGDKVS